MNYSFGEIARAGVIGLLVVAGLGLSACGKDDEFLVEEEVPVGPAYNEAQEMLNDGDFRSAAEKFEEVERQHPYSEWARKAILMSAYSRYQGGDYDGAVLGLERYLALHPGSEDAPYAQYLIAESYYDQIPDVTRDQSATEKALSAYREVARLYPESRYARDARRKLQLTYNQLAGKEMEVGRYYLNRRNYIAAINRFKVVVTNYQTSTHIEEALMRLTESYMALGITSEAQTAAAILGHNYPSSEWYKDAYALLQTGGLEPRENRESFLSRAWRIAIGE